jgi:hypothetical protein
MTDQREAIGAGLDEPRPRNPIEPAGTRVEMPLPQNMQSVLLLAILVLAMFYTLYFASAIILPIAFAFVLNLLLQPSMRIFARLRVPKTIAALLIMLVFFGGIVTLLASPCQGQRPHELRRFLIASPGSNVGCLCSRSR